MCKFKICKILVALTLNFLLLPLVFAEASILEAGSMFKPLIADPKWPRFTLAYQYDENNTLAKHAFAPNFGGNLALIRGKGKRTAYEVSIQGGVFALMAIGQTPTKLINTDYYVALALTNQFDPFTLFTRVSHTSGHLGDEFMLTDKGKQTNRINLSYEKLEMILSLNNSRTHGFRPYWGAGYIITAEPSFYKSLTYTTGLEYRHHCIDNANRVRPLIGVHLDGSHNYDWRPSFSIKTGLQFENSLILGKNFQVLLEYYNGNSIHGQFYKLKRKYFGLSFSVNI